MKYLSTPLPIEICRVEILFLGGLPVQVSNIRQKYRLNKIFSITIRQEIYAVNLWDGKPTMSLSYLDDT